MAQRKINQLRAAGGGSMGAPGVAGAGAAGGQSAGAAAAGSPVPGGGGGGDGVALAIAAGAERLHGLLHKRTAELEEREDALIKAER